MQQLSGPALAREALLPVPSPLAELLGTPGLRRGGVVVVHGGAVQGATSLLLGLLAGPSSSGAWCAVVGAPELGLVAADELGVALEHLLLVPEPGGKLLEVAAALLDGCDVVCLRPASPLGGQEARRLLARARERRAALVVATGQAASLDALRGGGGSRGTAGLHPAGGWPEAPDVLIDLLAGGYVGIGRGGGRLEGRLVEVAAHRRRASPEEVRRRLWLPGPERQIAFADLGAEEEVASACRPTGTS